MTFSQYVPAFSSENKPYTFSVGWLTRDGKIVEHYFLERQ